MPKRNVFRHEPVEHHLHVVADVRVPVLVDGQAGGSVQELDVHQADGELRQFRKLERSKERYDRALAPTTATVRLQILS